MSTFIHQTAIIYPNVKIGENVYIGPYCIIGASPEWKGKSENYGVSIGDNTIITGLVTIDGGAEKVTIIGSNCYLMKHSHIGHDAIVHNNVTISCGAKIGGHSIIGQNTIIGLNAVIHQRVSIAEGCMIGASAFIGKTLITESYSKYAGVPAKLIGLNKKS